MRPIIMLDGEHEINDIFFDNVKVPVQNLIGEENKGWTYAKFLLSHERSGNAGIGACKRALMKLKEIAAEQPANGRPLLQDSRFRDRIAQVEMELMALEITNLRVLSGYAKDSQALGPEVSMLKIKGSEIIQTLAELKMHALGHDALPYVREALDMDWVGDAALDSHYGDYAPPISGQYFNQRKTTIYAGSTEVQKNIISQMILGCKRHTMEFDYTEEQLALQDTLQRFVSRDYDFDKRKLVLRSELGYSAEAWKQYAELGLLALPLPEDAGGLGGNGVDIMVVMQQFGQGLLMEPYLSSVVLCGGLLRDAGSSSQQRTLLPKIADGSVKMALACYEAAGRYDLAYVGCTAKRSGDGWQLSGRKTVVLDGPSADYFLVSARTAGKPSDSAGVSSLFVVPKETRDSRSAATPPK